MLLVRVTDYVTVLANVRQQPFKLFVNVYGGVGLWENVLDLIAIKLPTANAGQYATSLRVVNRCCSDFPVSGCM